MTAPSPICPSCGIPINPTTGACAVCTADVVSVNVTDEYKVQFSERVVLYGAPGERDSVSRSQARYEVRAGIEPSQRTESELVDKFQRFDRNGQEHCGVPWYDEKVVDPDTGQVLTDKSHPLSEKGPSGTEKPRDPK